ncbi:MAG: hypothetical protein R3C01_08770 [Planctomycetaceae bacterium]
MLPEQNLTKIPQSFENVIHGSVPPDEGLTVDDLVARLQRVVHCRTGNRIRDLQIQVYGDDVVISGVTTTYYAKQLATHAALNEVANRRLTNSIEVC